jgi:hypothetical protein
MVLELMSFLTREFVLSDLPPKAGSKRREHRMIAGFYEKLTLNPER